MVHLSGDEWFDSQTQQFLMKLSGVILSDKRTVSVRNPKDNAVRFFFRLKDGRIVELSLELWEFGYEGYSEAVNGRLYFVEGGVVHREHMIPGGYTNTRDPKELWRRAKKSFDAVTRML